MTLKCITSIDYKDGQIVNSSDIQLSANGTLGGDSFAVYTSNNYDASLYPAWHIFDGNDETYWLDTQAPVDVIFYNPTPIRLEYLVFANRSDTDGYTFTSGTLYGSNDNITYELIQTFTNNDAYAASGCEVLNGNNIQSSGYYKYHKLHFTAETISGTGLCNIFFVGYEAEPITLYHSLVYETSTPVYSANYQGTGSTNSSTGYTTAGTDTLTPFGTNGTLATNYGLDKEFYIQVRFKASQWSPNYDADSVQIFNMFNRNNSNYPIQFGNGQDELIMLEYTSSGQTSLYSNPSTDTWYTFKVWCEDNLGEIINYGLYDEDGFELIKNSLYSTYGDFQNAEIYFLDIYGFISGTSTRNYQGYITYDGYNTYIAIAENAAVKWRMATTPLTYTIKMYNSDYSPSPTPAEVTVNDLSSDTEFGQLIGYVNAGGTESNFSNIYPITTSTGYSTAPSGLVTGGYTLQYQWIFPNAIDLTEWTYDTTGSSGSYTITAKAYNNGTQVDISNMSSSNPVTCTSVVLQYYASSAVNTMPCSCKNMTIKYLSS